MVGFMQQPEALYAGCVLFGLSVGNVIAFPALIVACFATAVPSRPLRTSPDQAARVRSADRETGGGRISSAVAPRVAPPSPVAETAASVWRNRPAAPLKTRANRHFQAAETALDLRHVERPIEVGAQIVLVVAEQVSKASPNVIRPSSATTAVSTAFARLICTAMRDS
jgi:hypothetical protein